MLSPIYQYVINLVASLPIRRGPGVHMVFRCGNILLFTTRIFDVAKFIILTPLYYSPDVDSHSQFSVLKYSLSPLLD